MAKKHLHYSLPSPSSGFETELETLPGRDFRLYAIDEDNGQEIFNIIMRDVYKLQVTYHSACSIEMIENAYDSLIEYQSSEILNETKTTSGIENLRHFQIYFDDGPAYDFICMTAIYL